MKNKLRVIIPGFIMLAGVVMGVVASSGAFDRTTTATGSGKNAVYVKVSDDSSAPSSGRMVRLEEGYSAVVKKAAPSVVNISTSKRVTQMAPQLMLPFDDPMFRQFFGTPRGNQRAPRMQRETSLGSGVIISKDGYIITNDHVVNGADEIKVTLASGKKEYTAKVVGHDPRTDVAVLKIDAQDLPSATLGNSDKIEVGDIVLAIGSPFGLSQTVTMGIVSAKGRGGMGIEDYEDFIQTDAAINPGNSGGALVDAQGRVIGINTAILSRTGGNVGVGFAVPINLARSVMDSLVKDGKIDRGYMGVLLQEVTPALAEEFKIPEKGGALIAEVTDNSAAADAGLKAGDVVIEFEGKPVEDSRQLKLIVGQRKPGDKVTLKVLRQGKEKSFEVKLKSAPGEKGGTGLRREDNNGESDALDGVTVGDINAQARQELDLPANLKGALVVDIEQDIPAFEAGLRQGDVILEINRKPVNNAEDAVEISKHIQDKRILLRVFSRGGSRYLVVDESKAKTGK